VRPVGGSPPAFPGASALGKWLPTGESPGTHPDRLPTGAGRSGFGPVVGSAGSSPVLGRSHPCRDTSVVGRARGQVPAANLTRVRGIARSRRFERSGKPWSAERPFFRVESQKAHEGRGREADPTAFELCSEEALQSQESIGRSGLRSGRIRTSAGSKALELRGIVVFWSSEQKSAMSETARGQRRRKAYGSAGGKSSEG
jgi:hypothetical protein